MNVVYKSSLTMTLFLGIREGFVDFSYPYFFEPTVLITKKPSLKNRTFAVFTPFRAEVGAL